MENKKSGGGDKVIKRLRFAGDVAESTSIKLFVAATAVAAGTVVVRLLTDWRVASNNNKRKKGGDK